MGFNKVRIEFYRIAKMLDSLTNAGIVLKTPAIVSGMTVTKNAPAVFAVCVVVILLVFNIALKVVVDGWRVDAVLLSQVRQYRLFETWTNIHYFLNIIASSITPLVMFNEHTFLGSDTICRMLRGFDLIFPSFIVR